MENPTLYPSLINPCNAATFKASQQAAADAAFALHNWVYNARQIWWPDGPTEADLKVLASLEAPLRDFLNILGTQFDVEL